MDIPEAILPVVAGFSGTPRWKCRSADVSHCSRTDVRIISYFDTNICSSPQYEDAEEDEEHGPTSSPRK
jgi:hypothetical protein